jgi:hypothetical protein
LIHEINPPHRFYGVGGGKNEKDRNNVKKHQLSGDPTHGAFSFTLDCRAYPLKFENFVLSFLTKIALPYWRVADSQSGYTDKP